MVVLMVHKYLFDDGKKKKWGRILWRFFSGAATGLQKKKGLSLVGH